MKPGEGNNILAYIYSKPRREYNTKMKNLSDKKKARIYEWEKNGVRFRLVVRSAGIGTQGKPKANPSPQLPKTRVGEIITFYSDRNLKKSMEFKNPKLKESK